MAGTDDADSRGDSNSDSEDDDEETNEIVQEAKLTSNTCRSIAYQEFLRFLELGCFGSPSQGYPTIVIILSTIPSPVCVELHDSDTHLLIKFQ